MMRRAVLMACVAAAALPARAEEEFVRGPVRPQRLASVGPQNDGVVRDMPVAEGAVVRQGDVLLHLDDAVQAARIGLARASAEADADLRQAQIVHQEAQVVLARTMQAAGRGAATEWEVRQARARVESTAAQADAAAERRRVERHRLELELAQQQQLVIRAPFDGVVTRIDTTPGATLTRADRPITVADLSVLEAVLYFPAEAWKRLRIGTGYPLRLAEPVERTVEARLRHMDPVMDAASGRFRAVFTIANPDHAIPAGLEASLDLTAVGQ